MAEEKKEAAKVEEKAPAKKVVKAEKKTGALIYVGPTMKGSLLRTFKIFADGIPEEYKNNAIIRGLFVPPEKLNAARAEIGKKGSALNVFYGKVDESLKGGK